MNTIGAAQARIRTPDQAERDRLEYLRAEAFLAFLQGPATAPAGEATGGNPKQENKAEAVTSFDAEEIVRALRAKGFKIVRSE